MIEITVHCLACHQDGYHDEMYRGCQRPCPNCGKMVLVAIADDAPAPKLLWLQACHCGTEREAFEEGAAFEITFREEKIDGSWMADCLPLNIGGILGLGSRYSSPSIVSAWACDRCQWRIYWLKRLFWSPYFLTPLFWLALMAPTLVSMKTFNSAKFQLTLLSWGVIYAGLAIVLALAFKVIARIFITAPLRKRFGKGTITNVCITN